MHKLLFGTMAGALLLLPVVLLLAPTPAGSSDASMQQLPAFNKFRCLLCHTVVNPTGAASSLNSFGRDFQANDNVWDRVLAEKNSDGDRCDNGFELGDRDGDGVFDFQSEPLEISNPGNGSDCAIALTRQTWGAIKDVFRQQIQFELEEYEDAYDLDPHPQFP
ncbi:MAG: hypothetical protein O7D32_08685 [bacterium]|nr:hypothetical protein [bacterium]